MTIHVVADENMPAVEHYFGARARVSRVNGRSLGPDQLRDADVLLVRSVTRVDEALLAGSPVRYVGTATSGTDHIDRNWLEMQGIGFSHAPGSNANSVVEYVLCAIAAIDHKLERLLEGASLGVIGYGVIGTAVVARFGALGIDCCVYDPWLEQETVHNPASLQTVLNCDVISLHAELTREKPWPSHHLLSDAELAGLGEEQLLINASRGAVVDNNALLRRLQLPASPTVVVDVWEGEPAINDALLDRVALGSAHIAGYSFDGKILATRMLCERVAERFGFDLPRVSHPAGDAPTLQVDPSSSPADFIRSLLSQRYDIRADEQLLRLAISGIDQNSAAVNFDALRKHYAERRELSGSVLQQPVSDSRQAELALAMGCTLFGPGGNA